MRALAANKLRSVLTTLGIIIGVAAVIALLALGNGVQQFIDGQFQQQGSNLVFVFPARIDVRGTLTCGRDVTIDIGCIFEGTVSLADNVTVGPYCVIGRVEIGDSTVIQSFVSIHDDSRLGRGVFVADHCTIGGQGFGHVRNERGELENMPHLGRVVIEDDVELFPHTNVDLATLSETRICRGAKIDHYCHIGHNCYVGEGSVLAAKIVLCGGVRIGSACWIGVGTLIRDGLVIGRQASTGFGSVVTRSIPEGELWAGSPARPIAELVALQQHLRRLSQEPPS